MNGVQIAEHLAPILLSNHETSGQRELTFWVSADCPYFMGHFPGHPVLPGIVQIQWALYFAQEHIGLSLAVKSIGMLKFRRLIYPNTKLKLELIFDTTRNRFLFLYSSDSGEHSQGRLTYEVQA